MAASRKEYELLFQLKAALGPNFVSSFKTAMQTTKQLQGTLDDVRKVQSDVSAYKKQHTAVEENKKKLALLVAEHEKLQREMQETENPSDKLRQNLSKTEKQIATMTGKIEEQQGELDKLGSKLRGAGVDTGNLNGENERLRQTYKKVADEQEKLAGVIAAQERNAQAIANARTELLKTVGVATALGAALYAGPIKSAMELESYMAEVSKVVDWVDKSGTAEEVEQYKALKKAALDVTTQIPLTAKEITDIMAAAGQSGVAIDNSGLVRFTTDAAKMGIAFDTTAEQSGEWMAKWRTSFRMSQDEVVALSDKINYLGNTSAAKALEISDVVTRIGPLGEVAGFASGEIAALGGTLIAVGVSNEVAATGIKNTMLAMVAGESATKKQKEVLKSLGLDAKKLANRMQTDATGAIMDFMGALRKLPEAEQAAALQSYFGKESLAAIAPLLTNLELLEENFKKVGDSASYAGSMEAEYAARADTTENKVQLAQNSIAKLSTTLGDTFLPYVGQAAEKVSELVTQFADYAEKNPEVIKNTVELAFKLLALRAAGQAAYLGFLNVRKGVLATQKVIRLFAADSAAAAAATATGAARATTSIGMLRGAFTLLTGPVGWVTAAVGLAAAGFIAYRRAQYQARQDTLHFSDDLTEAADRFQEVSDKAQNTRGLIDEYRSLKTAVEDVKTPAEEVASAKERMYEIENMLIEQNPDVLNKYDQENGRIAENLDLLERKTEREMELARKQYEQAQYEAEQKLPDAAKEIASLERKTKTLDEQYEVSSKARNALGELVDEWIAFDSMSKSQEEVNAKLEEMKNKANEIKAAIGYEGSDYTYGGMQWIFEDFAKFQEQTPELLEKITKSQQELDTVKQSMQEYYDTSVKLAEIDLGSNFQTAVTNLANMKAELDGLTEKGEGGSEKAQKLQQKIAELEPKVETAAVQIRDLGTAIEAVPEVKTIDVEEAMKNVDGFIQRLNEIPTSKKVQLITEQVNQSVEEGKKEPEKGWFKRLTGLATGGIVKNPSIVHFAEEGPEAAIPLDGSDNAKRLWAQTGEILGMYNASKPERAPAFAAASAPAPELRMPASRNVEQSIVLHSNPVIHVGSGEPDELARQLQKHDEELLNMMEEWYRRKQDDERRQRYG